MSTSRDLVRRPSEDGRQHLCQHIPVRHHHGRLPKELRRRAGPLSVHVAQRDNAAETDAADLLMGRLQTIRRSKPSDQADDDAQRQRKEIQEMYHATEHQKFQAVHLS